MTKTTLTVVLILMTSIKARDFYIVRMTTKYLPGVPTFFVVEEAPLSLDATECHGVAGLFVTPDDDGELVNFLSTSYRAG